MQRVVVPEDPEPGDDMVSQAELQEVIDRLRDHVVEQFHAFRDEVREEYIVMRGEFAKVEALEIQVATVVTKIDNGLTDRQNRIENKVDRLAEGQARIEGHLNRK